MTEYRPALKERELSFDAILHDQIIVILTETYHLRKEIYKIKIE